MKLKLLAQQCGFLAYVPWTISDSLVWICLFIVVVFHKALTQGGTFLFI